MTQQLATIQPNIHLTITKGGVITTSMQIAEVFGKMHKDILKKIESAECSEEFSQRNFSPAKYADKQGKMRKSYIITRDGFFFAALGFTGKKAAQLREAYINEFNRMEATLKNQNKEVELDRIPPNNDVCISTCEIAALFDIDEEAILALVINLRDFASETPWSEMGVRINNIADDKHNLYLNLAAFLILDLGNSNEMRKQKFRVISAFEDCENERYQSEHPEEFEEEHETQNAILDFKNSAEKCNELNEALITDIEWKNNLTDKGKGNTITVAINLLDSLATETNPQFSKTKQKINNIKNLLENHQQYEQHINNEMLDRLVFLSVHLTSLNFSSIVAKLDEVLKPNELTIKQE